MFLFSVAIPAISGSSFFPMHDDSLRELGYPPLHEENSVIQAAAPLSAPSVPSYWPEVMAGSKVGVHGEDAAVRPTPLMPLRLATTNRLSPARETQQHPDGMPLGLAVTEHSRALQFQFNELGYHAIGVQEACSQCPACRTTALYHVIPSGSLSGVGGWDLWLARRTTLTYLTLLIVTDKHFQVLHSDIRRLLVALNAGCIALDIAVLHAHHVDTPDGGNRDQVEQRSTQNTQLVVSLFLASTSFAGTKLVVLTDRNARLGSIVSDAVGDRTRNTQHVCGTCFMRAFSAFIVFCRLPSRSAQLPLPLLRRDPRAAQ